MPTYTPVYCLKSSGPDWLSWVYGSTRSSTIQLNTGQKRKSLLCKCVSFVLSISLHGQVSCHHMNTAPKYLGKIHLIGESTRWLTFVFPFLSLSLQSVAWSMPAVIKLVIYSKQRYNPVTTSPLSFHKAWANVWWREELVLNGYWSDVIWISFSFFPPMDVEQGLFV